MHGGIDTFRLMLDSDNPSTATANIGEFTFDIRLPFTRSDYTKYILYVDNFNVSLRGLASDAVHLKLLNLSNYNSYSSQTKGNNNVVAVIYNHDTNPSRTDNLVLNYQAPQAPYHISSVPNTLAVKITDMDNTNIDFSSANNFWTANLRIDAYYDDMSC
tara:strand:+ start:748 stop:1224 length:477 start_codon:yes stop_codon:yes gene_type:complete